MTAFTHAYKTSHRNFKTMALVERLRRLCSEDPMLLALTIGIAGLIGMFCLVAMAAIASLFGADAFSDLLRDAGQQVGGAGGVGAAGAGAAGASEHGPPVPRSSAERSGLPHDYTTPSTPGRYYPPGGSTPTREINGKLYVDDYWNGRLQGFREVYRVEGGGYVDPGEVPPADLLGIRG